MLAVCALLHASALLAAVRAGTAAAAAARSVSLGFFNGSELRLSNVRDPNVRELPLPDHVKGRILAFEYGVTTPSTKLAAYDFDGTLASPHVCMGTYCPGSWEGSGPPVVPGGSVWAGARLCKNCRVNVVYKPITNPDVLLDL
eukprot:SAG31_NODE_3951_length_3724_cov_2.186483_1_plen_143_part_00